MSACCLLLVLCVCAADCCLQAARFAPSGWQCLGDFCDILRCPSWMKSIRHELNIGHASCRPRELEARRHFCQHMMHECLPEHSGATHALFEQLDAHFCAQLSCEWREGLRLGRAVLPSDLHMAPAASESSYHYVLAGLGLATVTGLYAALFCWYSATKAGRGDLRARRQRRVRWCGLLRKQKSY